jgi:hypothetical protein
MNGMDPLANLRDVHLPEAVSAWPPAPGWWIATAIIIAGLCAMAFFAWRRHQQRGYLRDALLKMQALPLQETLTPAEQLHRANDILKRCAMTAYPDKDIAPLSGESWLAFLNQYCDSPLFEDSDYWLRAWYKHEVSSDISRAFIARAETWLKQQPWSGKRV